MTQDALAVLLIDQIDQIFDALLDHDLMILIAEPYDRVHH